MAYPQRNRNPVQYAPMPGGPAYGTPGTGSSSNLGPSGMMPNGGRVNYSPYPPRGGQAQATPTRPGYTGRGPGRPPLNRDAQQPPRPAHPPGPPPPQYFYHELTFPPGPLPYFRPPPGQATRNPARPPPVSQAMYSTYASRLRTGVTGLVQPETITGGPREREQRLAELDREIAGGTVSGTATPRYDSPVPASARRPGLAGRPSGRRTTVNYAEAGSDEEESEEEEDDEPQEAGSDPEDGNWGGRDRRRRDTGTPAGRPSMAGQMDRDVAARVMRMRKRNEDLERGITWLGDRVPGDKVRSVQFKASRHQYPSIERLEKEAATPELLVPITVDFDVPSVNAEASGIKIKDRFLWNINERFITPEQFAQIFCDDVGIPASQYLSVVAELIQNQVEKAQRALEIDVTDRDVTEEDVVWSEDEVEEETREHANGTVLAQVTALAETSSTPAPGNEDEAMEGEEAELVAGRDWKEADCRVIVNLDVQIYTRILRDRIEWDLSSTLPPTLFAQAYCRDLGLTGEAIPLIAHAITDELIKHKRDALELGLFAGTHPDEQAKWEKTPGGVKVTDRKGAKGLVGIWRDWWEREEFGPVMIELSVEEMERRELERTREARRQMRNLTTNARRRR